MFQHTSFRRSRGCVVLLLALLLSSCGNNPAPTATVQPATATAPAPATATLAAPTVAPTEAATATLAGPTAAPPLAATATLGANSFQNPVLKQDFPDPFVLLDGGVYYAYATNGIGKNIQAAQSPDLVHWTLEPDAMPALPKWAKLGGSYVWAPEVIANAGHYLMYFTARDKASNKQCVGVAEGDTPGGPFLDTRTAPLVCQADEGGTIDPSPFRDGDTLYLYYKNDGNCCNKPTYLYVQPLAADGLSLTGTATQLVRNDALWEGNVVEAPTMVKHNDKYYLFFSANNYAGFEYAVGYATCAAAVGPCQDAPENPILASKMDSPPLVIGPGHQSVITIGGKTWIVYHVWQVSASGTRGSNRFLWIDPLTWTDGKPDVQGPTTGPQPIP